MLRPSSGFPRRNWHPKQGVAVTALLCVCLSAGPAAQAPRPEGTIKTEFVLRFPEFVQWPSLPAAHNGGYCIYTTSGNHPWAAFTTW